MTNNNNQRESWETREACDLTYAVTTGLCLALASPLALVAGAMWFAERKHYPKSNETNTQTDQRRSYQRGY